MTKLPGWILNLHQLRLSMERRKSVSSLQIGGQSTKSVYTSPAEILTKKEEMDLKQPWNDF